MKPISLASCLAFCLWLPQSLVAAPPAHTQHHWAFAPVANPAPPAVQQAKQVQTPIDAFVLARLEANGLAMAPKAARRTLIRRAYYDLIGLPPSPEQVEAFVNDPAPTAFDRVIEQLLASPHYGERWGRYWLDVARYADTKGYVFQEDRNYPYAYTYRDYVIQSLNEDLPFDQFIRHQLAADQMPLGEDQTPLAAMGFLTLGRRFLNNRHDIIDDRIDVVTRGLLGLTVTCARCHDHKYDPIPTADYYSLYGVFASSSEPKELPLLAKPRKTPAYVRFEQELHKRQQAVEAYITEQHQKLLDEFRQAKVIARYFTLLHDAQGKPDNAVRDLARRRDLRIGMVQRWQNFLSKTAKPKDPLFGLLARLMSVKEADWAQQAPLRTRAFFRMVTNAHPQLHRQFRDQPPVSFAQLAEAYGDILSQEDQAKRPVFVLPRSDTTRLFNRAERNRLRDLQRKVDAYRAKAPGAPPRAMVLTDDQTPFEPYIFERGNPGRRGPKVPRQFLEVIAGPERQPFTEGSGRRELAEAIACPDNPLTARVLVNRVWLHHFGSGLVRTPSDFGVRSEPPTHPQLLDYLARRFIASGWSLKELHRLIMRSWVYQQSSDLRPELQELDPDNRRLGRMNRRRLDWEALRDAFLVTSGQLDQRMGGKSAPLFDAPFPTRRTIYGFIDRQNLPGTLRAFDFAGPDQHCPQRFVTTVPQQALYLMNNPFMVNQARQLLARTEVAPGNQPDVRIRSLYHLVYHREPTARELALALAFTSLPSESTTGPEGAAAAWQYGVGRYDAARDQVVNFQSLPHFTGTAWQGGAKLPDAKFGWAMLKQTGGHAGNDRQNAVVRRWVAPRDAIVRIEGTLTHGAAKGDGVRGRIVSRHQGKLGEWSVHNRQVATNIAAVVVQAGDTIDFIVDCQNEPSFDSFGWAPILTLMGVDQQRYVAADDFQGPTFARPLSRWEQYAQALLLSNEFAFID